MCLPASQQTPELAVVGDRTAQDLGLLGGGQPVDELAGAHMTPFVLVRAGDYARFACLVPVSSPMLRGREAICSRSQSRNAAPAGGNGAPTCQVR